MTRSPLRRTKLPFSTDIGIMLFRNRLGVGKTFNDININKREQEINYQRKVTCKFNSGIDLTQTLASLFSKNSILDFNFIDPDNETPKIKKKQTFVIDEDIDDEDSLSRMSSGENSK